MIKCLLFTLFLLFLFLITITTYYGGQLGKIKEEILEQEKKMKKENKK